MRGCLARWGGFGASFGLGLVVLVGGTAPEGITTVDVVDLTCSADIYDNSTGIDVEDNTSDADLADDYASADLDDNRADCDLFDLSTTVEVIPWQ